jgi:hypothetical protein
MHFDLIVGEFGIVIIIHSLVNVKCNVLVKIFTDKFLLL